MPNDDYIKRSELIEHFRNYNPNWGVIDKDTVLDDIRDFPAADVEPKQRWIPVTERLPEKSGLYLCYTEFKIFAVLHFSRKHKLFNWFDEMNPGEINSDIKCIAWMPIPKPPKEEDDGK